MKALSELSDAELMANYHRQQEASLKNIDLLMYEVEAGRISVDDIDKEMERLGSELHEFNIQFRTEKDRRDRKKQRVARILVAIALLCIGAFLVWKLH